MPGNKNLKISKKEVLEMGIQGQYAVFLQLAFIGVMLYMKGKHEEKLSVHEILNCD